MQLSINGFLPGIHKVNKKLSGGRLGQYWYAYRGGPCILKAAGKTTLELEKDIASKALNAAAAYREEIGSKPNDTNRLDGLITAYLASTGFQALAPRTQADYRTALDVVRTDQGDMPLDLVTSKRARSHFLKWRERYESTPKTADSRMSALALVIQWGLDHGQLLGTNPLTQWPRLYKANRADIIWTDSDLAKLLTDCPVNFSLAVRFAAHTGIRSGDLVKITKSAIGTDAIIWQTGKSRGRRTVIIPITQSLRRVLDDMPASDSVTILTSAKGTPWTEDGLKTAMQRAKTAALARAKAAGDATSGIEHLRFHDLRGTAVTNLIRAGLSLEDVALIVGWSLAKVQDIAHRYVTGEEVALAVVERLKKNKR